MKFDNLEDKQLAYRSIPDYRLMPNSYVLCMVDGRSFSTKIKKQFKRPFDETFINIMNEVAIYVCKEVQGCKFAYVQSDEISFVITDFDTPESDAFFKYRLCKMNSIIASLATARFNQLMIANMCNCPCSAEDMKQIIAHTTLYQFDCKCWNVPTFNDAMGWFLYRQNDCVKNSKGAAAQAYLSHNRLNGITADEQIALLKETHNIDWHTDYNEGEKYGRFIYKETEHFVSEQYGEYDRTVWRAHYGKDLNIPENREIFDKYIPKKN